MRKARFGFILLMTILVCASLPVFYGGLDTAAVPPGMAALAIPAKRYELCTARMTLPSVVGGEEDGAIWQLDCYDRKDVAL